jgi:putative endonuclease
VYFEDFADIRQATARKREIKGWLRCKKIELIESINPRWKDLSLEWWPDR